MKHCINPTVDCVFKKILGDPANVHLLRHFLNSILSPKSPIKSVSILNPYNDKDYANGKLSIVDVKAIDQNKVRYQIEIQLVTRQFLANRMLYLWSKMYEQQLESGKQFDTLKPVISIWLLVDNLKAPKLSSHYHHHFQVKEQQTGQLLTDHMSIHLIELKKWQQQEIMGPADIWTCFFKKAKNWTKLPSYLNTPIARQLMKILEQFSEREYNYQLYQAREDHIRDERTVEAIHKRETRAKQRALAKAKHGSELKAEAEARAKHESELKVEAEARAKHESELKVEAEARAKHESELKVEAEARAEHEKVRAEQAELKQQRLEALLLDAGIDPNIEA